MWIEQQLRAPEKHQDASAAYMCDRCVPDLRRSSDPKTLKSATVFMSQYGVPSLCRNLDAPSVLTNSRSSAG